MLRLLFTIWLLASAVLFSCHNKKTEQAESIAAEKPTTNTTPSRSDSCHDLYDTLIVDFGSRNNHRLSSELDKVVSEIEKEGKYAVVRREYGSALESKSKEFYLEIDTCDNSHYYRKDIKVKDIVVAYIGFKSKKKDKVLGNRYSYFGIEEWQFEDTAHRDSVYRIVEQYNDVRNEVHVAHKNPIQPVKHKNSLYVARVYTPHEREYLNHYAAYIDGLLNKRQDSR